MRNTETGKDVMRKTKDTVSNIMVILAIFSPFPETYNKMIMNIVFILIWYVDKLQLICLPQMCKMAVVLNSGGLIWFFHFIFFIYLIYLNIILKIIDIHILVRLYLLFYRSMIYTYPIKWMSGTVLWHSSAKDNCKIAHE